VCMHVCVCGCVRGYLIGHEYFNNLNEDEDCDISFNCIKLLNKTFKI